MYIFYYLDTMFLNYLYKPKRQLIIQDAMKKLYVLFNSLNIINKPPTLRDSLLELPPHVKTIKQTSGHIDGRVLYYS